MRIFAVERRARGKGISNDCLYFYASRAGGQWRSHAKVHETEVQGWDAETYKEWMGMVRRGEGTEAGLGVSWFITGHVVQEYF